MTARNYILNRTMPLVALLSLATLVHAQPSNSFPCNAIELTPRESCTFDRFTNLNATGSGVPNPGCGFYQGGDVWFYVEVPASGTIEIQTFTEALFNFPNNDGWLYRGAMAIYSGDCGNLTFMECNVDNGSYHSRMPGTTLAGLTPGDTLWIRIWEYGNSDNGMFEICVVDLAPPACPAPFTVSGGGEYCGTNPGSSVQLSGSEVGVEYLLLRNGTIPAGTLAGTGSPLTWSPLVDEGTYKIQAEHVVSGCTEMMADSAVVTLYTLPASFTVSGGGEYFLGDTGVSVFLDGSELGTSYTLILNGTQRRDTHPGTGGMLTWSPLQEEGTYRVEAERFAEACPVAMNDSAVVELLDQLQEYEVAGEGGYCQGDTGVSVSLSGSDPGILYTLILNDVLRVDSLPGTGDPLAWSPVTVAGVYKVEAKNPFNGLVLLMNSSTEIEVFALPQLSAITSDVSCGGLADGAIDLTVNAPAPYEVDWSGPSGFTSAEEDLSDLAPGVYVATVTDGNNCVNTSSAETITEPERIVITLDAITRLSTYDAADGSMNITISSGSPPYTVQWSGSDDYRSTMEDPDSMTVGYYSVLVTDQVLCTASLNDIHLTPLEEPEELFIPESFSPNGDGYNDRFVIVGIENFEENELMVFNRQGVTLFYRANYQNDWDGTPEEGRVLGGVLPEGTYYYIFKYGQNNTRKGFVYINRE